MCGELSQEAAIRVLSTVAELSRMPHLCRIDRVVQFLPSPPSVTDQKRN